MINLQQREKVILAKYMKAEDIRETRKVIKDTMEFMKYQPKLKLYNISKYQLELENNLAEAWKDKQERYNHMYRKNKMFSIDHAMELHKKIRKEAKEQDEKMIRKEKPVKPKLEPLPYLKKIRENLSKSMELIETPSPRRTPTPEVTYVTKKLQFQLVDNSRKSAFQRQETKKFYTEVKSKMQ